MSDPNPSPSRRDLLATVGRLSIGSVLGPAVVSSGLGTSAAVASTTDVAATDEHTAVTADQAVNALEGTFGVHKGQRRNHSKGTGAIGTFVGTPQGAAISKSPLFSGQTIEVAARFSLAGGNPAASDKEKSARGMALEFRLPQGGVQHMTMLDTPTFFASMPKTFVDRFLALKPDPATGKPNPDAVKAFAAAHAESHGQATFLSAHNPPPSFADAAYYGIHTFKFINAENTTTMVKWRFVPQDGEKQLSDAEMESMPKDFLTQELIDRTQRAPARWDMIVTIGEPGDAHDDPTVSWPTDRKEVKVGTLSITSAMPQEQARSYKINFDPLVMGDGIAPTDDPVLLFRSPAYATSFVRRLRNA